MRERDARCAHTEIYRKIVKEEELMLPLIFHSLRRRSLAAKCSTFPFFETEWIHWGIALRFSHHNNLESNRVIVKLLRYEFYDIMKLFCVFGVTSRAFDV